MSEAAGAQDGPSRMGRKQENWRDRSDGQQNSASSARQFPEDAPKPRRHRNRPPRMQGDPGRDAMPDRRPANAGALRGDRFQDERRKFGQDSNGQGSGVAQTGGPKTNQAPTRGQRVNRENGGHRGGSAPNGGRRSDAPTQNGSRQRERPKPKPQSNDPNQRVTESLETSFASLNVNAQVFQPKFRQSNQRPVPGRSKPRTPKPTESKAQKESLEEQLLKGSYDCLICCGRVRSSERIWTCQSCFHMYHLACVSEWARKSVSPETPTWRCPACQNENGVLPTEYWCFCGKQRNPQSKGTLPHSCTDLCGKERSCPHRCNKLCHPGRCPPCEVIVRKSCYCGNESRSLRCDSTIVIRCEKECGKPLACGEHLCETVCHPGECEACSKTDVVRCRCGKQTKDVICGNVELFDCMEACRHPLACGNHECERVCHSGECGGCELAELKTCPCGKSPLPEGWRCSDEVPLCTRVCGKRLTCGHACPDTCHRGQCPPCKEPVDWKRCRCDRAAENALCGQEEVLCSRKCNKKKTCLRHKCLDQCCDKDYHICELVCGKKLSCDRHKCTNLCHSGNCPKCDNVSFDELSCHCGFSVIYPPIACNTRPPECPRLCNREHRCAHPVTHPCHSDENCPPCTALVRKKCNGGHKIRENIPCYLEKVSCGSPCDRPLPCTRHKCDKVCHSDECPTTCEQPCTRRRECGHPCKLPCHDVCPRSFCFSAITVTCSCGLLSAQKVCHEFRRSVEAQIQQRLRRGEEINPSEGVQSYSKGYLKCSDQCSIQQRNRQLAEAFQIDESAPPTFTSAVYSEFVRETAKKNWTFAAKVVQKLNELVELALNSAQACRSHSFEPMHRDQRRFIYEIIEAYRCTGKSYDAEPKRNVVVTAYKDKSAIPVTTLESCIGVRRPVPFRLL